eukprot:755962-Hanusia_phi.AAC.3
MMCDANLSLQSDNSARRCSKSPSKISIADIYLFEELKSQCGDEKAKEWFYSWSDKSTEMSTDNASVRSITREQSYCKEQDEPSMELCISEENDLLPDDDLSFDHQRLFASLKSSSFSSLSSLQSLQGDGQYHRSLSTPNLRQIARHVNYDDVDSTQYLGLLFTSEANLVIDRLASIHNT